MNKEQVLKARQLLGLTQLKLANALGWTTDKQVRNLEKGSSTAQAQTVLAIKFLLFEAGKLAEFEE
jgi:transcriptional regulator with XRE-family HTH domain